MRKKKDTTGATMTEKLEVTRKGPQRALHASGEGRWVPTREYGAIYSLPPQTLDTWRYKDSLAGRSEALPGYPRYRRYGRAVRYWVPAQDERDGAQAERPA